jgi:hypothetical protein
MLRPDKKVAKLGVVTDSGCNSRFRLRIRSFHQVVTSSFYHEGFSQEEVTNVLHHHCSRSLVERANQNWNRQIVACSTEENS